jgi:hypothetical protein
MASEIETLFKMNWDFQEWVEEADVVLEVGCLAVQF